ncbi:MAG TPA: hypothetical protein VGC65_05285 [Bacteroidia bacterium]|jgi:hypothetical protein
MKKITTVEELKASILLLETKQANEGLLLKAQFKITYENLRPVNLIKNTISDLVNGPDLKANLLTTTLSMAAGYLSKKAVIGSTHNPLKQVFGSLLQMGVTSLVSKNSDGIKSVMMQLLNSFTNKKDRASE